MPDSNDGHRQFFQMCNNYVIQKIPDFHWGEIHSYNNISVHVTCIIIEGTANFQLQMVKVKLQVFGLAI